MNNVKLSVGNSSFILPAEDATKVFELLNKARYLLDPWGDPFPVEVPIAVDHRQFELTISPYDEGHTKRKQKAEVLGIKYEEYLKRRARKGEDPTDQVSSE